MTTAPRISDQPDGINEHSYELPDPARAAERINQYIAAWGDGLIDTADGQPLYARDLEAITRQVLKADERSDDDKRWNDAVDWLLNSRHCGGDPDIQGPFWAFVEGLITRDELETFSHEQVMQRQIERGLDPETGLPIRAEALGLVVRPESPAAMADYDPDHDPSLNEPRPVVTVELTGVSR